MEARLQIVVFDGDVIDSCVSLIQWLGISVYSIYKTFIQQSVIKKQMTCQSSGIRQLSQSILKN